MKQIHPLPGKALVQLEAYWDHMEGSLVLPESVQDRRKTTGTVLAITPPMYARPEVFADCFALKDKRVMIAPHTGTRPFTFDSKEGLTIVPIDDLEAIAEDSVNVNPSDGAIQRCKWCGPAIGSINTNAVIMVTAPNGKKYCPRCKRGVNGELVDYKEVTLSSSELEKAKEEVARAKRARRKS